MSATTFTFKGKKNNSANKTNAKTYKLKIKSSDFDNIFNTDSIYSDSAKAYVASAFYQKYPYMANNINTSTYYTYSAPAATIKSYKYIDDEPFYFANYLQLNNFLKEINAGDEYDFIDEYGNPIRIENSHIQIGLTVIPLYGNTSNGYYLYTKKAKDDSKKVTITITLK